ncbi:hypothetical protein Tco_1153123 [Tanacetum coccineum]
MNNTTLNLYPTTSSSTARKSSVDLQQQFLAPLSSLQIWGCDTKSVQNAKVVKEPKVTKPKVAEIPKVTQATPIQIIIPETTKYEVTTTIHEQVIPETQVVGPSFTTRKPVDKGKYIAQDTDDLPSKLVRASTKIKLEPQGEPEVYEVLLVDGTLLRGTHDEVSSIREKEDNAKQERLDMTKIFKVSVEEFKEANITLGKEFVDHQVELLRIHNEKMKEKAERKKKVYDMYVSTMTKTRGKGVITNL